VKTFFAVNQMEAKRFDRKKSTAKPTQSKGIELVFAVWLLPEAAPGSPRLKAHPIFRRFTALLRGFCLMPPHGKPGALQLRNPPARA
jgi:hypothetical protein